MSGYTVGHGSSGEYTPQNKLVAGDAAHMSPNES